MRTSLLFLFSCLLCAPLALAQDPNPRPDKPDAPDKPAPPTSKPAAEPVGGTPPAGPDEMTQEQKESYAVGQRIGGQIRDDFKRNNVVVDMQAFLKAIADAMAGKSDLTPEELQSAMEALQKRAQDNAREASERSMQEGKDYLAKNGQREGVKTTDSGLQYEVLKAGDGASPTASDTVTVHYTGKLIDGTKFDSSVDRGQPATFPLNGVIKGWTEGLQLMKVGAKYKFHIPSELAYGPRGRPSIPPNAVLVFEVELLKVGE